jgi:hypothetical protein
VHYYLARAGTSATFLSDGDSVASRLFVVQERAGDETLETVVVSRRLRGVAIDRASPVDSFPTAVLWMVPTR